MKAIHRFTSTATAVEDITAIQSGKLGKGLKKFLTKEVVDKGKTDDDLFVVEPKLGLLPQPACPSCLLMQSVASSIHKKLGIKVNVPSQGPEDQHKIDEDLWRGIRSQLASLLDGLDEKDMTTMSLGLSHSLSRSAKPQFTPHVPIF